MEKLYEKLETQPLSSSYSEVVSTSTFQETSQNIVSAFKSLQAKVKKIQVARDQAVRERDEMDMKVRNMEREVSLTSQELKTSSSKLLSHLQMSQDRSESLREDYLASLGQERGRNRELRNAIDRCEKDKGQLEKKRVDISSSLSHCEESISSHSHMLSTISSQCSSLDNQLEAMKQEMKGREKEGEDEITSQMELVERFYGIYYFFKLFF